METVWWVFGQLWEKGLIYEGFKVMPFSAELGTPLSNFEANLNYKEVDDPAITVAFPLQEDLKTSIESYAFKNYLIPITQLGGIQIDFPNMVELLPFKNLTDYQNYVNRLKQIPNAIKQTMNVMKSIFSSMNRMIYTFIV